MDRYSTTITKLYNFCPHTPTPPPPPFPTTPLTHVVLINFMNNIAPNSSGYRYDNKDQRNPIHTTICIHTQYIRCNVHFDFQNPGLSMSKYNPNIFIIIRTGLKILWNMSRLPRAFSHLTESLLFHGRTW